MEPSVLPISVIIIAKNEEKHIGKALESVKWAEEVLVLNNESTDRTKEIAEKFSNTQVIDTPWFGYSRTKSLGVERTKHSWVFWLDADEVVDEELKKSIYAIFSSPAIKEAAFSVKRKNFFLGTWIKRCGWYPDRVVRLFNKTRAKFNDKKVHEGLDIEAGCGKAELEGHILHDTYYSVEQYFRKMLVYAKLSAEEKMSQGVVPSFFDFILRPFFMFFKYFILKKGFLQGTEGLIICLGTSFYTFAKYLFLFENIRNHVEEKVSNPLSSHED